MSLTGKQSPLGINFEGSILADTGLRINKLAESYMGISKTNDDYQFGKIVQDTVLRLQTLGIHDAWTRNLVTKTSTTDVYDNLINIGSASIPALGNAAPPSFIVEDPSGVWTTTAVKVGTQKGITPTLPGPATSGYALTTNVNQGQQATWYPFTGDASTNPNASITKWGYLRLHALQAWNQFNWNGDELTWNTPEYKEFLSSFLTAQSFIDYSNKAIIAMHNSKTFLEGVYSNMNDLISADVSGVSLSSQEWGNDLVNLGTVIDLSEIDIFGLPSSLLRTLTKYSALTEELMLALLASGFDNNEITEIINKEIIPTAKQEQQIYGSFLVIVERDLRNILSVMKCKTEGLTSLADLLSVRKIFPNSYQTLTVPMYNAAPGPTNSKTYYLIFNNGGVNSSLSTFEVSDSYSIGNELTEPIENPENFKTFESTIGSYLFGVIPKDDAIVAGAFSYAMQQIRNIKLCEFEKFAQVVRSNETISGLNLVNGTDKPTDQTMAEQGLQLTALGSGIHGTYTMSDLFGCMSGLPYPWELIYDKIKETETTKLLNTYRENFLAITWQAGAVTVISETREVEISPGVFQTEYRVESFVITSSGGGYGRGSAPDPVITASNNGTGTGIVGRNDLTAGSNGAGTFGRITSTTVTSQGDWVTSPPTATIQYPPTATLPVQTNGSVATGGTNAAAGTDPWPSTMNAVIQSYIDQANTEITSIRSNKPNATALLNSYWDLCGNQLAREQRTRYIAFPPVTIISPESSTEIRKDYFTNLYPTSQYAFIDSVPGFSEETAPNMTVPTLEAIADYETIGGQSLVAMMRESRNQMRLTDLGTDLDNNVIDTLSADEIKLGYLSDSTSSQLGVEITKILGSQEASQVVEKLSARRRSQYGITLTPYQIQTSSSSGIVPELITEPYIISVPLDVNPAIPVNLDARYTSSTLLPSSLGIQDAIDQVIECNCDCWID
jgi:hypothetical protein